MSLALQPLGPAGAPQSAAELVTRMGLWDDPGHAERPRVVVAMIGSADGHATVEGRAGGLGSPADRSVLRELRCAADALLVGSATLIKEGYATLLDPPQQDVRVARGLPREPIMATISRGLDPRLPEIALFAEAEQRVVVYTEADAEAPSRGSTATRRRSCSGMGPGAHPTVSTRRALASGSATCFRALSRQRATCSGAVRPHRSRVRWASIPGNPPSATILTRSGVPSGRGGREPSAQAECSRRNSESCPSREMSTSSAR